MTRKIIRRIIPTNAPFNMGTIPNAAKVTALTTTAKLTHQKRFFCSVASISPSTIKFPESDNSFIFSLGPYTSNVSNERSIIWAIFLRKISPSRRTAKIKLPKRRRKLISIRLFPTNSDCWVNKHSTNVLSS